MKSSLRQFYNRHHDLVNRFEISLSHTTTCVRLVVSTSWSFTHSWHVTGFVTRVARRMPLVEQELPTIPEHLSSPLIFSGFRVSRSVFFCVLFCRSLFVLLSFFVWSLFCQSLDLRVLIISLVSVISSMYIDEEFVKLVVVTFSDIVRFH
jgi:hypothetical protein